MKNRFITSLVSFLFILTSCSKDPTYIKLERDENSDLELWLTDKYEDSYLSNLVFVPGCFGCDVYLGSKYTIENYESDLVYVSYEFTGYIDTSDEYAVTQIIITDRNVRFYGFTLDSSKTEIKENLTNAGYEVSENYDEYFFKDYIYAKKEIFFIRVFENKILFNAKTTNKHNIVY